MRSTPTVAFLLLLALLLPAVAAGQSPAAATSAAGAIILVTGDLPPATDPTSHRQTVELTGRAAAGATVADVLDEAVGVKIKRYGGLGEWATAMIRGYSSDKVAIYIDGVPINGAVSGVVNLSDLPLAAVERIEIYRGAAPPELAAAGMAGAINIVTRTAGDGPPTVRVEGRVASFGVVGAGVSGSGSVGPMSVAASVDTVNSDGDYPYRDDRGTPFNGDDDVVRPRVNNDFSATGLHVAARLDRDRWRMGISDDWFDKEKGIPGLGLLPASSARYTLRRHLATLSADRPATNGDAAYGLLATWQTVDETFTDRAGEIGVGRRAVVAASRKMALQADLASWFPLPTHAVSASLYVAAESYDERNDVARDPGQPQRRRASVAVSLLDEWFIGSSLRLVPAVRIEEVADASDGDVFSPSTPLGASYNDRYRFADPKLGLIYERNGDGSVRFNVAKTHRVPTFTERFGDRGVVVGSPDLAPEAGYAVDAGVRVDRSFGFVEVTAFHARIDDLIAYTQNSQRTGKAINIGRARIDGVELAGAWRFDGGGRVTINQTWLAAVDESDIPHYRGNRLPDRPESELYVKAELPWRNVTWGYELDYAANTWLDRANSLSVAARAIHNLSAEAVWPAYGVTARIEAKNITDDRVADALGYPLPGRSYAATFIWAP